MNVLKVVKRDHDTLRNLFSRFERTGKNAHDRKLQLFEEIRLELQIHMRVEEEIFYPAVKALNGDGRRLVMQAISQHRDIETLLSQISRLRVEDLKFLDRMEALFESVDNHVEFEEREIFRFAEKNCPEDQLREMADEIEKRKKALGRQLAA